MPDATASSSPLLPPPYQSIDEISRNPITRARKRLGSDPVTSRKNAPLICDKPGVPGPTAYYRIPKATDISLVTPCQHPAEVLGPPSSLPPLPALLPGFGAVVDPSSSHEHLLPPKIGLPPISVYNSASANSSCFSPVSSGNEDVNPTEPTAETERVVLKCAICRKQVAASESVKRPGLPIVSFNICYLCNDHVKAAISKNSSCAKSIRLGRQELSMHARGHSYAGIS